MSIGPALKNQKILIGTAVGLMAIILLGSLMVSRNKIKPALLDFSAPSQTTQDAPINRPIDFVLQATPEGDTRVKYVLQLAKNSDVIKTVGFQLQISGATAVSSQNKTFTSEESLAENGWQTVGTQSTQSQSSTTDNFDPAQTSTISFGLVQLLPDKTTPTGDIVLGEFTVELTEAGVMPEFVLDEAKSEAITASGERLQARLVVN